MINFIKNISKKILYLAPKKLRRNHVVFNIKQIEELKVSIESNYLNRGNTKLKLSTREYNNSLNVQLFERLAYNRNRIAPWLNSIRSLKGANILEIGCGTGISTLALSEQGANVTGIDVDEGALKVAKDRMKLAGLKSDLHLMNADEINENFKTKKSWDMLPVGSFLSVIETPNRLWYYDSHTAAMPFYDWLPDELAYYYSKFSERQNFKDLYRELSDDNMLSFLRWGRGASYHEFELAIAPLNKLNIVSSLMQFEKTALLKAGIKGIRYIRFLKSLNNNLHNGFCYPYLDIVFKK